MANQPIKSKSQDRVELRGGKTGSPLTKGGPGTSAVRAIRYRRKADMPQREPDKLPPSIIVRRPTPAQVKAIFDEWMADDTGYDEETWPLLKAALEEDRLSYRPLFPDDPDPQ